ncbi:glycyl-radical enzyme activating protein [Candidatus Soleaferrea massiliensis]|uniref:glycyl-radical enzyme activating protein n=1 Tax=Candidatus Soleaferrea massiliensis TaxID=1470354 RepID=UPI00058FEE0D|nr:glycyl-radical enzyme activating protein [Candidatus Soleaferrea massiliensis]
MENIKLQGELFDIQRFSLDDGPGIRTVVFLKGCNQACPWCHNPESLSVKPQIFRVQSLCTACGRCAQNCKQGAVTLEDGRYVRDPERCVACGECVKVCPNDGCKLLGKAWTVDEVMRVLYKDRLYYRESDGGVTFSGGEPTLQHAFLLEMLKRCRDAGFHTAIETNGNNDWQVYESLLPLLDYVMIDLKHTDSELHRKVIGAGNERVLTTLKNLSGRVPVEVRVPVIPGFNAQREQLQDIVNTVRDFGIKLIRFLPYHTFGISKYLSLGEEYPYPVDEPMTEEQLTGLIDGLDTEGLEVLIGK